MYLLSSYTPTLVFFLPEEGQNDTNFHTHIFYMYYLLTYLVFSYVFLSSSPRWMLDWSYSREQSLQSSLVRKEGLRNSRTGLGLPVWVRRFLRLYDFDRICTWIVWAHQLNSSRRIMACVLFLLSDSKIGYGCRQPSVMLRNVVSKLGEVGSPNRNESKGLISGGRNTFFLRVFWCVWTW